jgi:hypothetical protein
MKTFKNNPELFFDLIGSSIEDDFFRNFQLEFDSTIISREHQDYNSILYKEDGLNVIVKDGKVNSIKFYLSPNPICQIYHGKVVNNLSSIIDETKITKMDDYKRIPNSDPSRFVNEYKLNQVIVSFDSMTGEMLTVSICK